MNSSSSWYGAKHYVNRKLKINCLGRQPALGQNWRTFEEG